MQGVFACDCSGGDDKLCRRQARALPCLPYQSSKAAGLPGRTAAARCSRTIGCAQKQAALLLVCFAAWLVRRMAVLDRLFIIVGLTAGLVRRLTGLDRLAIIHAAS